ncbi:ETC complex I subunit [Yunchengibacter salinarum]|uniref:ETC complex I subunit n=1 Tax=Yunchengibacter salinarum TaxID=3133399 RepID=UPI0035B67DFD
MKARIYRPAKTAMQSGTANTRKWVLEYEPEEPKRLDPLMGWTGSGDMRRQIKLKFDTRDEAIQYAKRYDIPHEVLPEHRRRTIIKAYADNFK